jgi:hypothetical protein
MLVGALAVPPAPQVSRTNFSGEWTLASATANSARRGARGEQETDTYLSGFSAFNCGRGCRIVHKGSTLTIENAQLKAGSTATSRPVSIVLDERSQKVVDSC